MAPAEEEPKIITNIEDLENVEVLECKDILISIDEITNKQNAYKDIGIDTKKFNFKPYNENYYRENFKNFPDSWYKILAEASQEKNKIVNKLDSKIEVKVEE